MRPCTVFQNHSLDAMSGPDDHVAPRLTGVAIAVVVPTRNSARTLRACLESIRAQRVACTLVVVDNHSTDETKAISAELADLVLEAGPERSAQRNRGAEATDAAIVGFIDSDMALSPEVVGDAAAAIRDGAASVIVPEVTVGEGYWARVRAYERTFYRGNDAIEGPRFFSRQTFDKVGGFDEAMTGPEDWVGEFGSGPPSPMTRAGSPISMPAERRHTTRMESRSSSASTEDSASSTARSARGCDNRGR
jgi:hypothetical protein